jgi:hypothetical protein
VRAVFFISPRRTWRTRFYEDVGVAVLDCCSVVMRTFDAHSVACILARCLEQAIVVWRRFFAQHATHAARSCSTSRPSVSILSFSVRAIDGVRWFLVASNCVCARLLICDHARRRSIVFFSRRLIWYSSRLETEGVRRIRVVVCLVPGGRRLNAAQCRGCALHCGYKWWAIWVCFLGVFVGWRCRDCKFCIVCGAFKNCKETARSRVAAVGDFR